MTDLTKTRTLANARAALNDEKAKFTTLERKRDRLYAAIAADRAAVMVVENEIAVARRTLTKAVGEFDALERAARTSKTVSVDLGRSPNENLLRGMTEEQRRIGKIYAELSK